MIKKNILHLIVLLFIYSYIIFFCFFCFVHIYFRTVMGLWGIHACVSDRRLRPGPPA